MKRRCRRRGGSNPPDLFLLKVREGKQGARMWIRGWCSQGVITGTLERLLVPLRMPCTAFRACVPPSCFLCMDLQVCPHQNSWSLFRLPSANSYTYPLYLPLYAVRLPLPRLARFHLTYFFSILTICLIYTNSSALLSVFFFFPFLMSLSGALMNTVGDFFFFFSSPTHSHLPKCLWLKILT